MTRTSHGFVTALQFNSHPRMDFHDIVEEFDIALQKHPTQLRSLTWDCDDIAILDRESMRVALGWLPPDDATSGQPWYIIVAVGARPGRRTPRFDTHAYEMLSKRLAERMRGYLAFDAVLRGPANRPVGADLIDATFDLLRSNAGDIATGTTPAPEDPVTEDEGPFLNEARARTAARQPSLRPRAGRSRADALPRDVGRMATAAAERMANASAPRQTTGTVQDAHVLPDLPSVPQRLTIFTFSLTMLMYVPAIGAMLLTYSALREMFPAVT